MRNLILCVAAFVCSTLTLRAQVSFTADDVVPPYNGDFLYGTNGGWYFTWDGNSLTDIAAGNRSKNIVGIESRTFRPPLPANFLDFYGYNVNLSAYQYAYNLGVRDITVILNSPADKERDSVYYDKDGKPAATNTCNDRSWMFKNMYTPIWDGGLNGTPYNDTNYCAKYIYEVVSRYKPYTKFWEVVNEPDFDQTQMAWRDRGQAGNWWENLPDPCSLTNLRAPVFQYIRWLRIAYDIIKTLDPTAYVCPGGLGYISFANILCKYTDNPVDGSVTAEYPKPGSAYFDVLSFHSYPQYALGYWSNAANGFVYERQSDKAAEKFVETKNKFDSILRIYGYDGVQKPKKLFICTETNIASASFDGYIGSDVAQTNYVIKTMVLSQKNDIKQTYFFVLGDGRKASEATGSFDMMGLFESLTDNGPISGGPGYRQKIKSSGKAFKTVANLLYKAKYDPVRTAALNLPHAIEGGAFLDSTGRYRYVLWARTTGDWNENASATFAFPAALGVAPNMEVRAYDWSFTGATSIVNSNSVPLTGTPVFLTEDFTVLASDDKPKPPPANKEFSVSIYPNPATSATAINFTLKGNAKVNVAVYNAEGRLIKTILTSRHYSTGTYSVPLSIQELAAGVYYCRFETEKSEEMRKFIVAK